MHFRLILCLLFLSSCQIYRSKFDCPPGEGVPCTSVTEIEKMIIETPEGESDIFLGGLPKRKLKMKKKEITRCVKTCPEKRVWVEGEFMPSGDYVEGHYIYLSHEG
jgi:hypothetical protein